MRFRLPSGRASLLPAALVTCLASTALVHGSATDQARGESLRSDVGRIVGRVRLGVRPSARPLSTDSYSRKITVPGAPGSELANVLVWIKDAPRGSALPSAQAELRQRGEMYVPHVVAIPAGSTVTFPNDDPLFHNVFSLSRGGAFDLGRYPQGETRTRKFEKAGIVKVYCHLHSHMSAIIAVFDHPWFAQPGDDGAFVIDRVPPGSYTLTGWHERAGATDKPITVEPGATARIELLVPIEP
jgi:plastocyanin